MTPTQLHDYLLNLKNKNSQDPNIAEYKKTIREQLRAYRSDQPKRWNGRALDHKDIVFYCAAGVRSALACEMAAAMGRTRLFNVEGGIVAWEDSNLPLEK